MYLFHLLCTIHKTIPLTRDLYAAKFHIASVERDVGGVYEHFDVDVHEAGEVSGVGGVIRIGRRGQLIVGQVRMHQHVVMLRP